MNRKPKNPHLGSTLDDFLEKEGIYEEATTAAIEKVTAWHACKSGRKAFVTLRFAGDELDPAEISAIVPVEPTRAHKKGEEFFAGPNAGKLRGRIGVWFLASDQLVDSDDLAEHLSFAQKLLYPAPNDKGRITKLRNLLERTRSAAHVTCFWHGDPGEATPQIPAQFRSAIKPLWRPTSKPISRREICRAVEQSETRHSIAGQAGGLRFAHPPYKGCGFTQAQ